MQFPEDVLCVEFDNDIMYTHFNAKEKPNDQGNHREDPQIHN